MVSTGVTGVMKSVYLGFGSVMERRIVWMVPTNPTPVLLDIVELDLSNVRTQTALRQQQFATEPMTVAMAAMRRNVLMTVLS